MTTAEETLKAIQEAFGPYLRPREEVSHIRRVLALHLESCLKDAVVEEPLALVVPSKPISALAARGLQRQYLEALEANIKARNEFRECIGSTKTSRKAYIAAKYHKPDHLHQHFAIISFQKKRDRLLAIEKHLDLLSQKPAASPGFLGPEETFRDCRPLPTVPKDVVTALTLNDGPATTHIKDLIDQLEKHVLRAKLNLKKEEQVLEQVKFRSSVAPETVSNSAKFEALNASRNELINWIEVELGKAGDGGESGDDDEDAAVSKPSNRTAQTARLDEHVAGVRGKYKQYIEARKLVLQLVSQKPKPTIRPLTEAAPPPTNTASHGAPNAHLLSPYLEELLALAHEQKSLITQKSHLNISIAKQLKDTCQTLDHLAEESQLIPAHPMPGATSRKPAVFGDSLLASETLDSASRVQPWVFAADSAKIATLEAVAEKIDEGQMALDGSMRTITEIDQLLQSPAEGKQKQIQDQDESSSNATVDESVEDIWLTEGWTAGRPAVAKKHVTRSRTKSQAQQPRVEPEAWNMLHGNLGLLRSEGEPS